MGLRRRRRARTGADRLAAALRSMVDVWPAGSEAFWIPIEPTALEWLRATVRAELEAILERIWREDHAGRDVPMPAGPRAMVIEVLEKAVHDCLGGTEADAALLRDLGAESLRAKIRADVEPVVRRACAADRPS